MPEEIPWFLPGLPSQITQLQRLLEAILDNPESLALWKILLETQDKLIALIPAQGPDIPLAALQAQYETCMRAFVFSIPQDSPLRLALGQYLREFIDSEVDRVLGYPPLPPYGQRLERRVDPPLTPQSPLGEFLRAPRFVREEFKAYADLADPREGPGRPPGPDGYSSPQEFLESVTRLIRLVEHKGLKPTQIRIAEFLQPEIDKRRQRSAANIDYTKDSTARLIRKYLPTSWKEFVRKALETG